MQWPNVLGSRMRALNRTRTHPSEDSEVFGCPDVIGRPGCGKIGKELFDEQQFVRIYPGNRCRIYFYLATGTMRDTGERGRRVHATYGRRAP
jgi:hypothetical protein